MILRLVTSGQRSSATSRRSLNAMSANSSAPTTTTTCRDFADNEELLLYLYADLSRLSEFASEDIIIHPVHDHQQLIQGIEAAQAHENALIEGTGGTLVMDVKFVEAYPEVGVVAGVLRARKAGLEDLAMPFRGYWRFKSGLITEHWETADDPERIAEWLKAASQAPVNPKSES